MVTQRKTIKRKRKPPSLANLPKPTISSPAKQFRLHNSPMPISPSYKKTKAPKVKLQPSTQSGPGVVSTSGTYIPPKGSTSPPAHPLATEQKRLTVVQPGIDIEESWWVVMFTFLLSFIESSTRKREASVDEGLWCS